MDDSRPLLLSAGGTELQYAVDERAGAVACGRMDDYARRLVDDEKVFVLVGDAEPDVLRNERGWRLERIELDLLAAGEPCALLPSSGPVDEYRSF
jgi:hypothetical protein